MNPYQKKYRSSKKGRATEKKYRSSQKGKIMREKSLLKSLVKNPLYYLEYRRRNGYLRRTKLLELLGNKCVKCGFSDWRALQIDHINGGGVRERKILGYGRNYYDFILNNPDQSKFQILCANCNWIKRYVNSETKIKRSVI